MTAYTLKDIPEDLWWAVKAKAATEKTTIKKLIPRLLQEWLKKEAS